MLSEYNTEFLDTIFYILLVNICEEFICSRVPQKRATSKVSLVYTA